MSASSSPSSFDRHSLAGCGCESGHEHAGHDFAIWQLLDSAFPTGGFAHSGGLEAAWQHDEVRTREDLASFLEAALHQAGHTALPFVLAAHMEPHRLAEFDQLCDAFTTNHVANRASRLQGRALLTNSERIFPALPARSPSTAWDSVAGAPVPPPFAHYAPVFGALTRRLGIDDETVARMFLFGHLRGLLAAAVRLNIVGPIEAQAIQLRLAPRLQTLAEDCSGLTLDQVSQTAPLLELWQGAQDRLYSRLFQS